MRLGYLLALLVVPILCSWNQFRRDPVHSAECGDCILKYNSSEDVKLFLKYGAAEVNSSAIVITDQNLLMWGDHAGYFYVVDTNSTNVLWDKQLAPVYASPAYIDNTVLIATKNGEILNVVAKTGRELWRWNSNSSFLSSPTVITSLSKWAYIGTMSGDIYGLTIANLQATLVWSFKTNGSIVSCPAVVGPPPFTVVTSSVDGCVYALGGLKGDHEWEYCTDSPIIASPVIIVFSEPDHPSVVIVGNLGGDLFAVQVKTGTLVWKFQGAGAWGSSPCYESLSQTIYIGNDDGNLYSFKLDGTLLWKYQTGGAIRSSPATIDLTSTVVVASTNGNVYAISTQTGTLVWQYKTGFPGITSSPTLDSDGTIYQGSPGGMLAI